MSPTALEILAPAKDIEVGRTAIACGADAVYIGPPAFGARAAAGNSVADIGRLCDYAHIFGARVYATMNTILFDDELEKARRMALELWDAGVDALIVQDMAYLTMDLPLALHASTQCDIRTPEKAALLARAGFTRLVLPREFTVDEISRVRQTAGVPVEVFIHGARCVSYSGDCQMGYAATGRSANRGTCPQMCRLPYELVDAAGRPLGPVRHYLSLSDMQTPSLKALADAGAVSFKIEGRLKDRRYVANATAWYSRRLDELVEAYGGRYSRSSSGRSEPGFAPDIAKGFFRRPNGGGLQGCLSSPNDTGEAVARVTSAYSPRSRAFRIEALPALKKLANGDGLGYFDREGNFHGFRLNRAEGENAYPAAPLPGLKAGMTITRNSDKAFNDSVDAARPVRRLRVDFAITVVDAGTVRLSARAESGAEASVDFASPEAPARTPQQEQRRHTLGKLGDTCFSLGDVSDSLADRFVAASALADGRRRVLESLTAAILAAHSRDARGTDTLAPDAFAARPPLDYHDNIANARARAFYTGHGATIGAEALECRPPAEADGRRVMATKYCIRRELGACLRTPQGSRLPEPLFLRNDSGTYRLEFDCRRCGMNIYRS